MHEHFELHCGTMRQTCTATVIHDPQVRNTDSRTLQSAHQLGCMAHQVVQAHSWTAMLLVSLQVRPCPTLSCLSAERGEGVGHS
jgi:hypothetical protein